MKLKLLLVGYLILSITLALIPDFEAAITNLMSDWNNTLRTLMYFFFDPNQYVWKWIIALLVTVAVLFKK